MSWPNFEEKTWTHLLKSVNPRPPNDLTLIQASDRDAGAITMARANAARAGVSDYIQFECQSISAISPPSVPGWLITNPPYGLRIHSNKDIRNLYAQFGKVLRTNCTNWRTAVLCSDPALLSQTGLKFTSKIHFSNGGINVSLGECVVP
jgi:putative N6-adenine-specific DNA methylase